uniref:Uncharacterized protein n=1 Tax=Setaria digitata TaxID=48799 RepID=A0A915Q700_9BILA
MLNAQIVILTIPAIYASLGGKAVRDAGYNRRLVDIDNYIYLSICGYESQGVPNVTVILSAANNETNKFYISKYNIIQGFETKRYIENAVAVEIRAQPDPRKVHRFNPKKITIRYDDHFYKFQLNPQCLQNPNYWTSPNEVTVWSKKIDCRSSAALCDDNTDMFLPRTDHCPMGALLPVTNVIFKNGVTKYQMTSS